MTVYGRSYVELGQSRLLLCVFLAQLHSFFSSGHFNRNKWWWLKDKQDRVPPIFCFELGIVFQESDQSKQLSVFGYFHFLVQVNE